MARNGIIEVVYQPSIYMYNRCAPYQTHRRLHVHVICTYRNSRNMLHTMHGAAYTTGSHYTQHSRPNQGRRGIGPALQSDRWSHGYAWCGSCFSGSGWWCIFWFWIRGYLVMWWYPFLGLGTWGHLLKTWFKFHGSSRKHGLMDVGVFCVRCL